MEKILNTNKDEAPSTLDSYPPLYSDSDDVTSGSSVLPSGTRIDYNATDKYAVVMAGGDQSDSNNITFFSKKAVYEDSVYGMFQSDNPEKTYGPWSAAQTALKVARAGLYTAIEGLNELDSVQGNLSLHFDNANSKIAHNNEQNQRGQSLASGVLLRVCHVDGRVFLPAVNVGQGLAFRVPKDYKNERIEPLFVEQTDHSGESLVPLLGEEKPLDGMSVVAHPPFVSSPTDRVIVMSGPVKPSLSGENHIYDNIREALDTSSNPLDIAKNLASRRADDLGLVCLVAVIEI